MGKYLKNFTTESDYHTFKGGEGYIEPNVSLIKESNHIYFNPKMIKFAIQIYDCYAIDGMTFYDWALSSYYNYDVNMCIIEGLINNENLRECCKKYQNNNQEIINNDGKTYDVTLNTIILDGRSYIADAYEGQ